MAYLQSIRSQAAIFFGTAGYGFLLGAVYDFWRFIRLLTGSRRTAAWDIAFGAFAGTATFVYFLTCSSGKVRVYLLAAIGVGFAIWYFCASSIFRTSANGVLRTVRQTASDARRLFVRLSDRTAETCEKLCAPLKKVLKKFQKNRKSS